MFRDNNKNTTFKLIICTKLCKFNIIYKIIIILNITKLKKSLKK